MTYAVSDIHGCYDKFSEMLRIINFSDSDVMYILGDTVDRGDGGIPLLLDIMRRENVTALLGNHDCRALCALRGMNTGASPSERETAFDMWLSDGGLPTLRAYEKLLPCNQKKVLGFLGTLPCFRDITVNGRRFFLSHTGACKEKMQSLKLCTADDFTCGRIEYDKVYFKDKYFVSGHTPTALIDPRCSGRIYRGNGHIAIDCGASFGKPLGCICLDTLEEFYTSEG